VQCAKKRSEAIMTPANVFEEALYWFISAPALVYVVYLIFGL
jgi:hypothetical protein